MRNLVPSLIFVLISAFCLACLTGCISFQRHLMPRAGKLEPVPDGQARPSVEYIVLTPFSVETREEVTVLYDSDPNATEDSMDTDLRREMQSVLEESGRFSKVTKSLKPNQADVHISVRLNTTGKDIDALTWSVYSLFIIPTWYTGGYEATAAVRARTGKTALYTFSDGYRTFGWLPCCVLLPILSEPRAEAAVRTNMYRTLLLRMKADGLL